MLVDKSEIVVLKQFIFNFGDELEINRCNDIVVILKLYLIVVFVNILQCIMEIFCDELKEVKRILYW